MIDTNRLKSRYGNVAAFLIPTNLRPFENLRVLFVEAQNHSYSRRIQDG
jgi:hypothetical protein